MSERSRSLAAPDNPIMIDYGRDGLFSPYAIEILKERYLVEGETSPQEAFARVCLAFADDEAHAQRLYEAVSLHHFMFATPVLANGGTTRGLPISCFLNYVPDTKLGIRHAYDEVSELSSLGGGIGMYWGDVRPAGKKGTGTIPFIGVVDRLMLAFNQGTTRRGSGAVYLDIGHPEIEEFLTIRKPTGGDANRKSLNLHQGINIPDSFMRLIEASMHDPNANDDWPLIDPNTLKVTKVVSARGLWEKIIEMRMQTGEPYMHFIDTSNRLMPKAQRDLGLRVKQSNLCVEIMLHTGPDHTGRNRTAVCCLSSVNAEKFADWPTTLIGDLVRMLDNVLQHFIDTIYADKERYKDILDAAYSAEQERAIGLGLMGFHALLQSQNVAFNSPLARSWNKMLFQRIKDDALHETMVLGAEKGEAPDMVGTGRRNSHLLAIAPNASSSLLCGETSPGIEPYRANAFNQKTLTGTAEVRNRYLDALLRTKVPHGVDADAWLEEQWTSIFVNDGSVQHLPYLSADEKKVFETFPEIDQQVIVMLAADRAPIICQGQSLNLAMRPDEHVGVVHAAHYAAWKKGVKSLYYLRSISLARAEDTSGSREEGPVVDFGLDERRARFALSVASDDICVPCQG